MGLPTTAKKILYITYDGLTDSLGQSQILPYVKGLSQYGYRFTILSFEKKDKYLRDRAYIEQLTSESGIEWVPLPFTSTPPLLSKAYDAIRMKQKAAQLQRTHNFDMVHCRSYISADAGLMLKRKFGVRFFFDMRGFWADEKKDGTWDVSKPLFKRVYKYYKYKEAQYLQNADCIISLTEAGKNEMKRWPSYNKSIPLQVIPCCADMNLFSLTDDVQKAQSRKKLGIGQDKLVISYLGSIGTWYMLDEMLQFFKQLKQKYADAMFLFITHTGRAVIDKGIERLGLDPADVIITEAARNDVPGVVKASDVNISFIKPVYSKMSSSPTKLGEVLSMGIPIICNSGVGDVEEMVSTRKIGSLIHGFSNSDFSIAIDSIPGLLTLQPAEIRMSVKDIYSLDKGISEYLAAYKKVFN